MESQGSSKPPSPPHTSKGVASDASIDTLPSYSKDEMSNIINKIISEVDSHPIEAFYNDELFLTLTYVLQNAIQKQATYEVHRVCLILETLRHEDADKLADIMARVIRVGPYKGQNFIFTWMDQLYSTVLNNDSISLINLNFALTNLMSTKNSTLVDALLKEQNEGSNKGMNALLPLTHALLYASEDRFNHSTSLLLANLITTAVKMDERRVRHSFLQSINHSAFSGQSLLSLFANILVLSSKNDSELFNLMLDMIVTTVLENDASLVTTSLSNIIKHGPDEGTNTVHILLNALVSATHSSKNADVVNNIAKALNIIISISPPEMHSLLLNNISSGDKKAQNGVAMLLKSLLAAVDNNYTLRPILTMFDSLIKERGGQNVEKALRQKLPYQTSDYFDLLESYVRRNSNHPKIKPIINLFKSLDQQASDSSYSCSSCSDSPNIDLSAAEAGNKNFFKKTDQPEEELEADTIKDKRSPGF